MRSLFSLSDHNCLRYWSFNGWYTLTMQSNLWYACFFGVHGAQILLYKVCGPYVDNLLIQTLIFEPYKQGKCKSTLGYMYMFKEYCNLVSCCPYLSVNILVELYIHSGMQKLSHLMKPVKYQWGVNIWLFHESDTSHATCL